MNDDSYAPGGIAVPDGLDRSVVRLWGDVDATLREQASSAMVALLSRGGPYVIDVSEVTFIDSSGLAFILQVHRMAADAGSTAVLLDPPALVVQMLDIIGLSGTIPFEFTAGDSARASATVAGA